MDKKERWITIKGNHILIKNGQSVKEAIKERFYNDDSDDFLNNENDKIPLKKVAKPTQNVEPIKAKPGVNKPESFAKSHFQEQFNKILETNLDSIEEEVAKRFLGTSDIWNMKPEEIAEARKTLGLKDGEEITLEGIKKWIKDSIDTQERILETETETFKDNSPERQEMRKDWIRREFEDQADPNKKGIDGKYGRIIKKDKIALISLGNAGSGKSSAGGKNFLNQYGAYEIDPDRFKAYTPEMQSDTNNVGLVHEESSMLAKDFFNQVVEEGANLFYPMTGSNIDKIRKVIDRLKEAGYQVNLDFIDLDIKENITRTITRGLAEHRYTTPSVIAKSYIVNQDNFEELKDEVDGYRLWNNDAGAKIVETSEKHI